jgi:hypothetical protein
MVEKKKMSKVIGMVMSELVKGAWLGPYKNSSNVNLMMMVMVMGWVYL